MQLTNSEGQRFRSRHAARMLAAMASAVLVTGAIAVADPMTVLTMPSYGLNETYANTYLNVPVSVWGAVSGGTSPYTYTLDFGDGTSAAGSVADPTFIGEEHTYTAAGLKTVTLIVTDSASVVRQSTAVVRVFPSGVKQVRINMAIEKALLYFYKTQHVNGYWQNWSTEFQEGQTALAVAAFEENGHLPDTVNDIYADTVKRGVDWIVAQAMTWNITNHDDGTGNVRVSDRDADGKGVYFSGYPMYANACMLLAVGLSCTDAADAQNTFVASGSLAGWSYWDVINDAIDQILWAQSDGSYRGSWAYGVTTASYSMYDGSAMQWPVLAMSAAQSRYGISAPQWCRDNTEAAWAYLRNAQGGFGYYQSDAYPDCAKSGGALATFRWLGKTTATYPSAAGALQYIGANYLTRGQDWSGDQGWAGDLYAMYNVKKGLELIDNGANATVNTTDGARDWYEDFSAYLLGDTADLPPSLVFNNSLSWAHGQYADGHWSSAIGLYGGTDNDPLTTAWGVLVLTRGVAVAPPVAHVADVGSQPPGTSFIMDGSSSFHLDPSRSIVEWLWDFDASDGLDWGAPDAVGPRPTHPGYPTNGDYVVTLLVRDDSSPASLVDTDTTTVQVNQGNHPPVARPIPTALLPSYAGQVNEAITLDGSESSDPDAGDDVAGYRWDLDGDGVFGDATSVVVQVSYTNARQGLVGLIVTDTHGVDSVPAYVDIAAALNDISVLDFSVQQPVAGAASFAAHVVFTNDAASLQGITNVLVRFYDGNPFLSGNRVGDSYWVNLPKGGTATLNAVLPYSAGLSSLHVFLDADERYIEWDETNNVASVAVEGGVGQFKDVTRETTVSFLSWRLNKQTGTLFGTMVLSNTGKSPLTGPFWYAVQRTANAYLMHPNGKLADGKDYVDISAAVRAALASVGNRDAALDPGEAVTMVDAIEMYQRYRQNPSGLVYALWADPPHPFDGIDGSRWNYRIDDGEILTLVDLWMGGDIGDFDLLDAIEYWKAGWYSWDAQAGRWVPRNG